MKRLIAALLLSSGAYAQEAMTGNELLDYCSGRNAGICTGYIMGMTDGLRTGMETGPIVGANGYSIEFCIPEGVTVGQIEDIVVEGLKENPSIRHLSAAGLVAAFIAFSYPCPAD